MLHCRHHANHAPHLTTHTSFPHHPCRFDQVNLACSGPGVRCLVVLSTRDYKLARPWRIGPNIRIWGGATAIFKPDGGNTAGIIVGSGEYDPTRWAPPAWHRRRGQQRCLRAACVGLQSGFSKSSLQLGLCLGFVLTLNPTRPAPAGAWICRACGSLGSMPSR